MTALRPFPAGLLPPLAREQLQRAALTPVTEDDPFARVKAINRVLEHLQAQHPEYFRPVDHEPL